MTRQPTLETQRLVLRPFVLADAEEVQRQAGDREIASTTLNIPHPYEDGLAEAWILGHPRGFADGHFVVFAIVRRRDEALVGCIGLTIERADNRAEMGYWVGRPYWGQGYATEAAHEMVNYGFSALALVRIHASHLARNPSSGRVMEKVGMVREGCLRKHALKWGLYEDLVLYGLLAEEYEPGAADGPVA
jgi:RimJ/RimL family protein N-acetyltransferase